MEILHRWQDERRRVRKRRPQLEAADVVFLSHAKSGRTWLRVLASHVWHRRYGTPVDEIVDLDNLRRRHAGIPSIYFTHEHNEPRAIRRRLQHLVGTRPLLFMVRDPRDIVVSFFFEHSRRSTAQVRRRMGLPTDIERTSMAAFMLNKRYGLPACIDFLNRWERFAAQRGNTLVLRYEDLRADPAGWLDRVMRFLGTEAAPGDVEAAVRFASFEGLREKERSDFFRSEKIRAGDPADPDSFKVRRGKIGGYRDYFDEETLERIDTLVARRLSPRLGYAAADTAVGMAARAAEVPFSATTMQALRKAS